MTSSEHGNRGSDHEAAALRRLEEIYRDYSAAVLRYALRRTAPSEAHDAVSETFLAAWRRLEDVPEDALPWLYGVALKVIANQRRGARRQHALSHRLMAETATRPDRDAGRPALPDEELSAAFQLLTEREREVLRLAAWEGLNSTEGARVLGCSAVAFRLRLLRARKKLGVMLERPDQSGAARVGFDARSRHSEI